MKQHKPQNPKGRNRPMHEAMMGKRSSNAAGPHRLKTTYTRKTKHKGRNDEQ